MPDSCNVVQSPGFQPVNQIAACQHNDRVPVFTDLAVSLGIKMGGGDQNTELAVPQTRDEPTGFPYTDAIGGA
jgi:hypothetical protein